MHACRSITRDIFTRTQLILPSYLHVYRSRCDHSEGYTYNQGVIVGALGLLYSATPAANVSDRIDLLHSAEKIATAVALANGSRWRHGDGVLREPCETTSVPQSTGCNADQTQFKGVFVRYLRYYLNEVPLACYGECQWSKHSHTGDTIIYLQLLSISVDTCLLVVPRWELPAPSVQCTSPFCTGAPNPCGLTHACLQRCLVSAGTSRLDPEPQPTRRLLKLLRWMLSWRRHRREFEPFFLSS